jgi:YVTN family beta-propeller protein
VRWNLLNFRSTSRSCEISLLPTFSRYPGALLLEELFAKFDARVIDFLQGFGAVKLHHTVPTQFVGILVANQNSNNISVIDTTTRTVVAAVQGIAAFPEGFAMMLLRDASHNTCR